ncbi:hypothetical protein O3P69_012270 [Scylla paramamosain]|uniref:Secreted protein n=1 Tax=Scylla paramamosain TaxID=85552 RepID=A0AAW0TDF4_SCYPA
MCLVSMCLATVCCSMKTMCLATYKMPPELSQCLKTCHLMRLYKSALVRPRTVLLRDQEVQTIPSKSQWSV